MIEGSGSGSRAGSGSGSIPLTNGSGSGRPKTTWTRWIRIRNTATNCAGDKSAMLRKPNFLHFLPDPRYGTVPYRTVMVADFEEMLQKLLARTWQLSQLY